MSIFIREGDQIVSSIDPEKRERSHAGNAYLGREASRSNLEIVTDVVVDRVTMENDLSQRVSGVQFWQNSYLHTVLASKEVTLCAGAFGTPCILQRSGIGERKLLEGLGIHVGVENESVGRNLQDHVMAVVSFELKDGINTTDNSRDSAYTGAAMKQYQENRTSPLTGACVSFAYMPLLEHTSNDENDGPVWDTFARLCGQSYGHYCMFQIACTSVQPLFKASIDMSQRALHMDAADLVAALLIL